MSKQVQSTPQEPSEESMPPAGQELPGPVVGSAEPDRMVYQDGEGIERSIRIPLGQFQTACEYYISKDWDALRQFPQWSR